jgi:hypothetical protein
MKQNNYLENILIKIIKMEMKIIKYFLQMNKFNNLLMNVIILIIHMVIFLLQQCHQYMIELIFLMSH